MYSIFFTVSVAVCTIFVTLHLDRRSIVREKVGDITKIFLMPTLYFTLFTAHLAFPREIYAPWIIIIIATLYTLGDVFLLFKKSKCFYLGVVSFLVGHIFYIIYFSHFGINVYFLLFGMVLFAMPIIYLIYKVAKSKPDHIFGIILYAFVLYLFGVGVCSVFSLNYPRTGILAILGVGLYIYSDSRIAFNKFIQDRKKTSQFWIMLTYVAANICLVLAIWCINVPVV